MFSEGDDDDFLPPDENIVDEGVIDSILMLFPTVDFDWLRPRSQHGTDALINYIVDNEHRVPRTQNRVGRRPEPARADAGEPSGNDLRTPVALDDSDARVEEAGELIIESLQSLLQVEMDSLELTSVERSMLFEMCQKVFSKVKTRVIRIVTNNRNSHPLHAMVILALASRGLEKYFLERPGCLPPELLVELSSMKPLALETNRKFKEGDHDVALSENLEMYWQEFKNVIDMHKQMFASTNFECLACMSVYKPNDGLGCTDLTGFSTDFETHRLCLECVRGQARAACEEAPIAHGGQGLPCPQPGCSQVYLISRVRKFLSSDERRRLDVRIDAEALSAFGEIERCKNCPFGALVDDTYEQRPSFTCPECNAHFCRKCKLDWSEAHVGRTCDELVSDTDKARKKLEEELTDAVLRKCSCGLSFQKADGCNKMTCRCGKFMCYICRAQISGYDHFSDGGVGGKCPTYSTGLEEDTRRLKIVRDNARANVLTADIVDVL